MTQGVICSRCSQERWPVAATGPYICQRCREVLAGGGPMTRARATLKRPRVAPLACA